MCRVLSTFSPRSQLTRDSKVCRVLSTFSPSSGGSSASNLLEPSRTTSSTPNSCKNSTRPAISVMLTPPPRSDRVRSTVVQAHLTSSNLLEPHHYRDSLLPLAIANNALHCTSTHPTNVHMYVHLLGTCMYNVPLYQTHTQSGFLFKKCSYRVVDVSSILTHCLLPEAVCCCLQTCNHCFVMGVIWCVYQCTNWHLCLERHKC